MLVTKYILFTFLGLFTFTYSHAEQVVVIDGDTIRIGEERIRFSGIDAPEIDQICIHQEVEFQCGVFSKILLIKKISNKEINCIREGKDFYGRTLAECFLDKESLSSYLIREGYAFAYRKYSQKFIKDEEYAAKKGNGMWGTNFLFPWDFRKVK